MSNFECDSVLIADAPPAMMAGSIPSIDTIVTDLIAMIRSQTQYAGTAWTEATPIQETGIDSFDFVELVFEVEDKYGIDLNFNANNMEALQTVADVAKLILARLRAKGCTEWRASSSRGSA